MEPDIRAAIIFPWETCQDSRVKETINNDVERHCVVHGVTFKGCCPELEKFEFINLLFYLLTPKKK
ncbi:hypothetical protein BpHYR1_023154 [Brachionus plicatilis]|uniref:Uncharacterized protein n=1 Tax=Brachionus plicatilis TaxID=10195 RepID=A0A3M7S9I7_BRAPC|nr:hypothetical protein BpHYR1_023154 [Brachionus plicatilis]